MTRSITREGKQTKRIVADKEVDGILQIAETT